MLHGPWADPIRASPAARATSPHPIALAAEAPEDRARRSIARMLATLDDEEEHDAAHARVEHRATARR